SAADQAAALRHDGSRNRWFLDPLYGRGYPADVLALLGEHAPLVMDGDLAAIAHEADLLGVKYYFPEVVEDAPEAGRLRTRVVERHGVARTAFGWEVFPQGLTLLLERIHRDYQPKRIYLTENGSTYEDVLQSDGSIDDGERRDYLRSHLEAARRAVLSGVPLSGYFAWSLLDNFEWAEGYVRRFGLTYVDFVTQKRTLKASGQWYADFLQK
ncbi:MAG: family 1 glycosylhydrolase, partial [Rhodoferax sp.]